MFDQDWIDSVYDRSQEEDASVVGTEIADKSYSNALKEHFASREDAKHALLQAEKGDVEAIVKIAKFADQTYLRQIKFPGSLFTGEKAVVLELSVDGKAAEYYKQLAIEAGDTEFLSFHDAVRAGERQSSLSTNIRRHPDSTPVGKGEPRYMRDVAEAKNGYPLRGSSQTKSKYSGFDLTAKGPNMYAAGFGLTTSLVGFALQQYSRSTSSLTADDASRVYLAIKKHAVPALIESAKAGDTFAMTHLINLYRKPEVEYKDYQLFGDKVKTAENPIFSLEELEYWKNIRGAVYAAGAGDATEEQKKLVDDFIFSQATSAEGQYNIAMALLREPAYLRAYYNRKIGADEQSLTAGIDFLKHASISGSSIAANKLAALYYDGTIAFQAENQAQVSHHAGDKELQAKAAAFWSGRALDCIDGNGDVARESAKYRLAQLAKEGVPHHGDFNRHVNFINPSEIHLERYPDSIGIVPNPSNFIKDYSYLEDPSQGTFFERLQRGLDDTADSLSVLNKITQAFDKKVENIRLTISEKEKRKQDISKDIKDAYKTNTDVILKVKAQERQAELNHERWVKEQIAYAGTGILLSVATAGVVGTTEAAGALGKLAQTGIPRAAAYFQAAQSTNDGIKDKIVELIHGYKDVEFSKAQVEELADSIEKLRNNPAVKKLLSNEIHVISLRDAYQKRQFLFSAYENTQTLDYYAKEKAGIAGGVDALVDAFKPTATSTETQVNFHKALSEFCVGEAGSNNLHLIMAYADSLSTPVTPAEKALKAWVEGHVKPNIDDYIINANRVDIVEDASIPEIVDKNDAATTAAKVDNAKALLIESNFSTVGGHAISKALTFYLTRHGKRNLHDDDLNDGIDKGHTAPKRVQLLTDGEIELYEEKAKRAYRHGRPNIPQPDNLFLRYCASEYFEPQSVLTSGIGATFKDHPQAPVSYPMVHRVVNDFVERMSLSPLATKYREKMEDKEALDNLIAQSFIDFFAVLGQTHVEKFKDLRNKLAHSYSTGDYGRQYHFACDRLTDDAQSRYELFQDIFMENLNKTLETSTNKDSAQLLKDLRQLKEEGADIFKAEKIIYPGSPEHLESFKQRTRMHENRGAKIASLG